MREHRSLSGFSCRRACCRSKRIADRDGKGSSETTMPLRTSDFRRRPLPGQHDVRPNLRRRLDVRLSVSANPTAGDSKSRERHHHEEVSAGYAPAHVFRSLSLQEGGFVVVCRRVCGDGRDTGDSAEKRVVIRLKLDEEDGNDGNTDCVDKGNLEQQDATTTSTTTTDAAASTTMTTMVTTATSATTMTPVSWLRVSPVVAANLGLLFRRDPSESSLGIRLYSDEGHCWLEEAAVEPLVAERVVLRPIGMPAPAGSLSRWLLLDDDQRGKQRSESWVFPPPNTLIQASTVITVQDAKRQTTYHYDVLEAISRKEGAATEAGREEEVTAANSGPMTTNPALYQIHSSTDFVLDRSPLMTPFVRRLSPRCRPSIQPETLQFSCADRPGNSSTSASFQGSPSHRYFVYATSGNSNSTDGKKSFSTKGPGRRGDDVESTKKRLGAKDGSEGVGILPASLSRGRGVLIAICIHMDQNLSSWLCLVDSSMEVSSLSKS